LARSEGGFFVTHVGAKTKNCLLYTGCPCGGCPCGGCPCSGCPCGGCPCGGCPPSLQVFWATKLLFLGVDIISSIREVLLVKVGPWNTGNEVQFFHAYRTRKDLCRRIQGPTPSYSFIIPLFLSVFTSKLVMLQEPINRNIIDLVICFPPVPLATSPKMRQKLSKTILEYVKCGVRGVGLRIFLYTSFVDEVDPTDDLNFQHSLVAGSRIHRSSTGVKAS
jgi:hypothetical protein